MSNISPGGVNTIYVNCNLCGSDQTDTLFEQPDALGKEREVFRVVRCRKCGLVYVNPRPSDECLQRYYPQDFYWAGAAKASNIMLQLQRAERWITGPFQRDPAIPLVPGSRLLDVGCGIGTFLMSQKARGMEVFGVEPSGTGSRCAREERGLNVFPGTLEQAAYPGDYFDAVYITNVIEHVPNPRQTLMECHHILKEGGIVAIETPDVSTWDARIFKKYWRGADVPRHLHLFSPATLRSLLDATGFEVTKIRHQFTTQAALGSLWLMLEDKKVSAAARIGVLAAAYPFTLVASLGLSMVNLAGNLQVRAKKSR